AYSNLTLENPAIVCDPDFETNIGEYLAYRFPGIDNGRLLAGVMLFNSQSGSAESIDAVSELSVKHIVAFALGMFAGLGPSQHSAAIMHPITGSRQHLALAQDDVDGLSYLYPNSASYDDLFGCGIIARAKPPPGAGHLGLVCLVMPLVLAICLRQQRFFIK